jgi:DNA (cytosine-5)-methyltransferase 1
LSSYSVVDIFAGPGGLAEGFSSVPGVGDKRAYQIALSIEKERAAHSTLRLRSFLRQFKGELPQRYYDFLMRGGDEPDWATEYPREWARAADEAWQLELGKEDPEQRLNGRIDEIRKQSGGNSILIGGPPCQAYSLVGRARNQGKKDYIASDDEKHFLYKEYIRILDRLSRGDGFQQTAQRSQCLSLAEPGHGGTLSVRSLGGRVKKRLRLAPAPARPPPSSPGP